MGPSFEVSLSKCTEMVNEHMGEIRSESLDVTELQLDITVTPCCARVRMVATEKKNHSMYQWKFGESGIHIHHSFKCKWSSTVENGMEILF